MTYRANTIAESVREGRTDANLVAGWLFYHEDTAGVINALPAALMGDAPNVIQNVQAGVNMLWARFGVEDFLDFNLQAEINLLIRDPPQSESSPPAKRARMA